MLNKDADWDENLRELRSGKRYKLNRRKRNTDGECKKYIEEGYGVVS